jgi:predicted  nucleic acid-binding Zn-ribbon protein
MSTELDSLRNELAALERDLDELRDDLASERVERQHREDELRDSIDSLARTLDARTARFA